MQLIFDLRKAMAAVAFLVEKEGDKLDMFLGLKMLYWADKHALIDWGQTITGDNFVSMNKGPVLSRIYNLFKGQAARKYQQEWNSHFTERVNQSIRLRKPVDIGVLSTREMQALEKARNEIKSCAPKDVADWLHKECPEWTDPHGSSIPINPRKILQIAGRTSEEIKTIEESNSAFIRTKELLGIS
jgi:uncharacterized phage-associated protein